MAATFLAVSALLLLTQQGAQAWVNNFDGPFTYSCPHGHSISRMQSYHSNNREDRRWSFSCTRAGNGGGSAYWTGWLNCFDCGLRYSCSDNYFLRGMSSYHSNNREDRRWRVQCQRVSNAYFTDCRFGASYLNGWDGGMNYEAGSRVITGVESYHDNGKEDRRWKVRTCKVNCDRDNGYKSAGGLTCARASCGSLGLENGQVKGSCGGTFGDECEYDTCDTGFKMSIFGSVKRTCGWLGEDAVWSGSAKTCEDIDECTTSAGDCFPGAQCVNTFGSFYCDCKYGTNQGDSCHVDQPSSSIDLELTSMRITLSGGWTSEFPKYKISVARWSHDLAAKEDIAGFPRSVSGSLTDIFVDDLEPGTRYRVTLTPQDTTDEEMDFFNHIPLYNGADPQTPCGCLDSDPLGKPTGFEVSQFKGHILFKWEDQSQCETAFSFTRNGVGLAQRFDVTEQQACGAVQEPKSFTDDLTIQSAGGYAEVDESLQYKLPEGTFYIRVHDAVETTDTRFKFPRELQRDGGHFSSTSTTTTAAPPGIPDDEKRYFPGTSSPVTSVSECKDLCDIRSDWCIAFAVETRDDDSLVCHQLRVVEETAMGGGSRTKVISYRRIDISGTGVTGNYIFEGTQDDCEQACTSDGACTLTFVDEGVCGFIRNAVETGTPLASIHPSLNPSFSRRIPGPEPGVTQRYCIAATSPSWYNPEGYSSGLACKDYTIDWESSLEGQVTIDSEEIHLPVEGVEVEFEIGSIRGKRVTNEDGKFYIHILTDKLRGNRHRMTLRFSKTTGNIRHTFACGGLACTEHTLIMEHLRFDQTTHVRDTTSLPFSGIVTIGGTEHEGLPDGCPLKDVEVCLYDRYQANTLINCDVTDAKGRYLVRSVMGTSVTVSVDFKGNASHTFERVPYDRDAANAPSGILQTISATNTLEQTEYYDILEGRFWENINFRDTTTDVATVDIAGGVCNLNLGDAVMEFRYDACPTWVREEVISERVTKWRLPAQIMTVRFKELTRNYEVRAEIARYFSAVLGNARSLYADLRNPDEDDEEKKTVRFEYHPPPQLTIEFDRQVKHDCNVTDEDGNVLRPMKVLEQNKELKATVKVIEDYGEGVGTCDAVPGSIQIENQLGETPTLVDALNKTTGLTDKQLNKLKACYEPCLLNVTMDEREEGDEIIFSNTHVEIELMTGEPETNPQALDPDNPFTKLFRASMHNLPYDPVSVTEKVVVIGDKVVSEYFSVPFPRYKPLSVVQDPPGGLSSVTYSKAYANYAVSSYSHEEYHGFYVSTMLAPIKVETGVQQCAGLGAAVCTKVADTESTPIAFAAETTNMWGSMDKDKNYATERMWSFAIELTTSDDPMMAGEPSDMFLVPSLNVVWMETEEVSFDPTQCTASKNTRVKWSLKGQSNTEVLSWVSAFEIENKELPDLRKLLKLAEESPDPDDTEEQQQAKIDELERAIQAWEDNLERNKDIRNQAGLGLLSPVQNAWTQAKDNHDCVPSVDKVTNPTKVFSFLGGVSKTSRCSTFDAENVKDEAGLGVALAPHDDIDRVDKLTSSGSVDASDADKQSLRNINAIKFSGGGSTYTFSYDLEKVKSAVSGSMRNHEFNIGTDISVDFKVFGVGMSFELGLRYQFEQSASEEHEAGVDSSSTVEFTLGDPDPFDVFDVEVFLHPDYGTFVFHTTSGQSSCPHEPNTVHLERPGISVLKRPLAPVLPSEPAVFELLLKNDGPGYSDYNLFNLNGENQDGLKILVDGQPLTQPIDFEGFPAGARYVTVVLERGPSKFKYEPVAVGWRSLCEADRHPDNGYLTDEVTTVEYVYLEADFLQPCSPVQIVGEIGETGTFTLNQETMEQDYKPGQIRIVAFNPDFAERTWQEDDRLEEVVVEFKPVNSHVWLLARDENGDALDIKDRENEYGYVTLWWDASTLLAGRYDLRIRAQCQASINEVPDGIDENFSETAVGVVDRDPPVVFGFPEPADGEFFPGDSMEFQFNEPVECRQPFIFQVSLTVEDYNRDFNNNNMVLVCEGRKISMSLRRGFRYDDVNGLTANLVIENVKDLNDNAMEFPPEHTFTFAELNLDDASATVNGLILAVPYEDALADKTSQAFEDLAAELVVELATVVDVAADRIVITNIAPADATDYSLGISVSLRFTPASTAATATVARRETTMSATALASLLQEQLQNSTLTQSLSVLSSASGLETIEVDLEPSTEDAARNAASSAASGGTTVTTSGSTSDSSSSLFDKWKDSLVYLVLGIAICVLLQPFVIVLLMTKVLKARLFRRSAPSKGADFGWMKRLPKLPTRQSSRVKPVEA